MRPAASRIRRDLSWTAAAFGVMGACGLALNFGIGRFYGAETLGAFSQVFALYLVLSQFAILGVWLSALKHVSELAADRAARSAALAAALRLALVLATAATGCAALGLGAVGTLTGSAAVETGWAALLPGFWAYSVNKVWMAALNGMRDMRAFALAQMARNVLMLAFLAAAAGMALDGDYLPLVLGLPELILFPVLALYCRRYFDAVPPAAWRAWIGVHFSFGLRGFLAGALAELNTRVDIMVLGVYSSDARVGLYAMAAMIAEGLAQLATVLRDNLNPLIAQAAARGDRAGLAALARRGVRGFYLFMVPLLAAAALAYPWLTALATGGDAFAGSWVAFCVLAAGLALGAGYLPLNMLLVQAGLPGRGTLYRAAVLATTLALNIALVPAFDILGAAAAMGLSYGAAALYLKAFVARHVGVRI
ncbi:MAG: oligosaccharide flippase family protein [Burkholderiales bacterium]|nr:oligosaccharide flippase family protein [Burkholderiales bacterium]